MSIWNKTTFISLLTVTCGLGGAVAHAQIPDYIMLKRCRATMDERLPSRSATWQIGVPFVSIQLASGVGGWAARHTFEFDTYAFCNGPNGYPEYGTGDDVCMGRAANLGGTLAYSTLTSGPDANSGTYSLTESPSGDYGANLNISATVNSSFFLGGYSQVNLTYYHHHAFRWNDGGDVARAEVSTDGGATWITVKSHQYYLGDKGQFKRTDVNLNAYLGLTVRVRFRFASNGSVSDDGWFIDDVRLVADGTTLFFDNFENGTAAWTLQAPWALSLANGAFANLGTIDAAGIYSTIPVTNPVTTGEGMGFGLVRASYTDVLGTRNTYAQVQHTGPQWKAAPELGYDQLCPFPSLCTSTGIPSERAPLRHVVLEQNSPNPFNPSTDIHFALPAPAAVSLRIYDDTGRLVRILIDEPAMPAGDHGLTWNGLDAGGAPVRSGVYFYELQVDGRVHTRKMVLLK